ncbi:MAG TPA: SDR family oxidoreductase [bacterium]|nr:SDR family oxidoreductase [bacterium]
MTDALILGASGQVGRALALDCERRGRAWAGSYHEHAVDPRLFKLDLSDLEALGAAVRERRPAAVFLPSGWTWVDGCEDDPARSRLLNALAPEAVAKACASIGASLVCYSTDYVFGERGGPYDESAPTAPLGVYGRDKLEGEALVRAACPGALILRTAVVYGPEPQGKNFIYQLRARLGAGQAMTLPSDQATSATYNRDLARASLDLVERGEHGVFNAAGPEVIDRYAFGLLAAEVFGLDPGLLKAARTAELAQKAKRPLDAGLRIDKLLSRLGWTPSGPRGGLERMKLELDRGGQG